MRRLRLELVAAGGQLAAAGMIVHGEGNLSARVDRSGCLITPAGRDKGRLAPADLLWLPLEPETAPQGVSTEYRLHLAVYRRLPEVGAVVHAHPPQLQALAAGGRLPDCRLLLEGAELVAEVGLVGPMAPGSQELADAVAGALDRGPTCVLAGHGAVAVASRVEDAVRRMLLLERLAALTGGAAR